MRTIFSILALLIATNVIVRADEDYTPTARDEAVADLASKRTEKQLLNKDLAAQQQALAQANEGVKAGQADFDALIPKGESKELHELLSDPDSGTRVPPPVNNMMEASNKIHVNAARAADAEKAIERIKGRLKELDKEIQVAKDNLQKLTADDARERADLRGRAKDRPVKPTRVHTDNCGKHP